ncbi:MAG: hypothetical protein KAS66_07205 [Candidatus Omnitrophica bacterium]|nr:hypothetical protein [Candidatus Omnitrophota bacterium]
MKKALLVIGERKVIKGRSVDPSCNAFIRHLNGRADQDAEIKIVKYKDVLANNLPKIKNSHLIIVLFFPFQHWNKNIEVYNKDSRVYGDKTFGRDFERFFQTAESIIVRKYHDKKIEYVNPPKASVLDRDKEACKSFFRKHSLPTPKSYNVKSLKDIQRLLGRGISLYIKPRFGSMGKGISYLSNGLLTTNFLFQKGKVISHPYDYNWRFHEITKQADKNKFLKTMILKGFIFEEAIDPPINKGRRSDFRVYCVYGKIPYYYVRSTPAVSLITNWSQGGKIEQKRKFSQYIPETKLKKVKSLAQKVAKDLELNYAGVDVIFSKDYKKIYVLEAHSFPGYEKGFDLMNDLARKILKSKK